LPTSQRAPSVRGTYSTTPHKLQAANKTVTLTVAYPHYKILQGIVTFQAACKLRTKRFGQLIWKVQFVPKLWHKSAIRTKGTA